MDLSFQSVKKLITPENNGGEVELGISRWEEGVDGEPHKHENRDEYFYFTDGNGTLWVEEEEFEVVPGMAVRIKKGEIHTFKQIGKNGLEMIYINIYGY